MVINVTQVLKSFSGQVMLDKDEQGNAVEATLRMAIVNALLSPVQKETGVDKVKKYELAKKVYQNDEVDLESEEITLIKTRIGEVFPPLIVGQADELLENK